MNKSEQQQKILASYQEWLNRNEQDGLTLATLCDMVLGEDAMDRSDEELIREVRSLLNIKDFVARARKESELVNKDGEFYVMVPYWFMKDEY